jgi:hypothetical protein
MACYQGPGYTTPFIHVLHPSAHHSLKTAPMLLKIRGQLLDIIIQTPTSLLHDTVSTGKAVKPNV